MVDRGLEPVVLLDLAGASITPEAQAERLARCRASLMAVRKDNDVRVRTAVLVLGFSGFPGWDNFECWNWWIPDIETRSLSDVRAAQHDAALRYVRAAVAWAGARVGSVGTVAHCAFHQHECVPHGHLVLVCVVSPAKGLRIEQSILTALAAVEPGDVPDPVAVKTAGGRRRPQKAVVADSFFELVACSHGFLRGTYEARLAWLEARLEELEGRRPPGVGASDRPARSPRTVQREIDRVVHRLGGPRRRWFWLKQWEETVRGRRPSSASPSGSV